MATRVTVSGHAPRKQLAALTTLRFLAAAIVVGFHCGGDAVHGGWTGDVFMNGYEAVSFFFVLSGFILTYVYASNSGIALSTRRFWIARIARVVPLYFLALLIALPPLVYSVFWVETLPVPKFIGAITTTPLFLQAWFPSLAGTWNMPAWSLSVEAFFYLIFPFVLPWTERIKPGLLLLAAIGVSVSAGTLRTIAATSASASNQPLHNLLSYFPAFHLPQFLVGIAVGRLFLVRSPLNSRWAESLLASACIAIGLLFWSRSLLPMGFLSDAILVPVYATAIYAAGFSRGPLTKTLSLPCLVLLGEASYGIYILHIPLYFYWTRTLYYLGRDSSTLVAFLLFSACLIFLSIGAYFGVERPGRAFLSLQLVKWSRQGSLSR